MSNKYLEKVSAMIRSVEGLVNRTNGLVKGIANRERKVNMGLSTKAMPVSASAKLDELKTQSTNKVWK